MIKRTPRFVIYSFLCVVLSLLVLTGLNGCTALNYPIQPGDNEQNLRTQAAMTMAVIEESIFHQMTSTTEAEKAFPLTQTAVVQEYITSITQTAAVQSQILTPPVVLITPIPFHYNSPIVQLPTTWYYPTDHPQNSPCNRAFFAGDVSYPDNTRVLPGSSFIKIWRIQNVGSCAWNSNYRLIDQRTGSEVGAMIAGYTPPGGFAEVSVSLNAPNNTGLYEENYIFRAGDGSLFGVGSNGITPIWVRVYIDQTDEFPTPQDRTRIQFPWGAVSTSLNGRISTNGINSYVLRANQGQMMTVGVISQGNHALLTIYGLSDGLALARGNASGSTSWQGTLPMNQDYALDVISDGNAAEYMLQITIQ